MRRWRWRESFEDVCTAIREFHYWFIFGWQDIKQRYRRSVLGPWWITLSMGIYIAALAMVYSHIFKITLQTYLPFLCSGIVTWGLISAFINEGCVALSGAEYIIRQVPLPIMAHILRMIWRNLIIFCHNSIIIFATLICLPQTHFPHIWHALVGLILLTMCGIFYGGVLGILCLRYRDVSQIIASLIQVVFFVTPLLWEEAMLQQLSLLARLNPFFYLIEVLRAPLLGRGVPPYTHAIVCALIFLGATSFFTLLARLKHRIAYWT